MAQIKPFLILQLRPEDEAADDELAAIMKSGGLTMPDIKRHRIDEGPLPKVDLDDFSGVSIKEALCRECRSPDHLSD
jgi:GMP synthase (glutamine-hydrolysing)